MKNIVSLRKRKVSKTKSPALRSNPQKFAECFKVFIRSPKKPNSAQRKVAKVRIKYPVEHLSFKNKEHKDDSDSSPIFTYIDAYIRGEGHSLQKHRTALLCGGRVPDLPGIKYRLIRGTHNFEGVLNRKTSRSLYGVKIAKKVL